MSGVAMGTRYSHFSLDERCRLRGLMEMGLNAGEIARRLGRHRGTIYREIARNRCVAEYRPDSADRMAWVRKLRGLEDPALHPPWRLCRQTALPWDGRRKRSPGGWSWTP